MLARQDRKKREYSWQQACVGKLQTTKASSSFIRINYTEKHRSTDSHVIQPHQLVAHRGYQKHFPENTLLAIRKAIEAGALFVECDVQLSADGVPLVYHDETLQRMSAQSGAVAGKTWAELQVLPACEPRRFGEKFRDEKIASLAALALLMQSYPQVHFYVELKEEAIQNHGIDVCLKQVARVLEPVMSQCTLISFGLQALAQAGSAGFLRVGAVLRDWETRDEAIRALKSSVMFINKKRIPGKRVIMAACPVVVYEVDDAQEAQRLLQRGASKIETFAIGEMLKFP
jgi:glycerophosphoryl diester phosphodiesterase